ncbi:GNAT family N-acetyltransferase [Paenibacillus eucommiae]|uniref:GNAT superfamily N-acetyltransferase n=1 Tax=Paenibacillus eucommiae TaxID=1355755 RepID=A0ABS4J0P9_9BACL|nr:GNAT family N-acetyltransferase [Paenibacillus eucommiae]MBP1993413.1 GNAT superfamily N-acetyltransferase [Paenibacillus eucommiae]
MTNGISITEYTPAYARSVAEMWNQSRESWGGGNEVSTEQSVLEQHEHSTLLKVFLALDGQEVVGYCSYTKYPDAEQTMYIPLLNVRPDYHGRKIGKELILTAVKETVARGYPYLDLFTWPGNTKAVPMYKKCGFFWEKSDHRTHLVNFIPALLQMEALTPYFASFDWYADGTRDLSVAPDGEENNGFQYLTYTWAREGKAMRVELEQSARGIRLVETEDYLIYAEIEHHELVFGRSYEVKYVIENKSGLPLHCQVSGRDDGEVRLTLEADVEVRNRELVSGRFYVDEPLREQADGEIRPAVTSEWLVNGRKLQLRTGIAPKYPAGFQWHQPSPTGFTGAPDSMVLTVENYYNEPASFTITVEENDLLTMAENIFSFQLPEGGRCSLPADYTLHRFGLYDGVLKVEACPEHGEPMLFTKTIHALFKGTGGKYGGETREEWLIASGAFSVHLNKWSGDVRLYYLDQSLPVHWYCPRLGRPFSPEFKSKQPVQVKWRQENETMVLEALYLSSDFAGASLVMKIYLHPNGLVERCYEVRQLEPLGERQLHVLDAFRFSFEKCVIPFKGKWVEVTNNADGYQAKWDAPDISENWLFSTAGKIPVGICWPEAMTPVNAEHTLGIEHVVAASASGGVTRLPSVYIAIGTFADWTAFRSFALQKRTERTPLLTEPTELVAGLDGNPFIRKDLHITLVKHDGAPLAGTVEIVSEKERFVTREKECDEDSMYRQVEFSIENAGGSEGGAADVVKARYRSSASVSVYAKAVFPVSEGQVRQVITSAESGSGVMYTIDNGLLQLAASPEFGRVFHSLQYQGREWLSTSYPKPGPNLWWNPWYGGIGLELDGISQLNLSGEERSAEFVSLTDQFGNAWSGLRISTSIKQHKGYRGLDIAHYALMLPGTPVLCCVNWLNNQTGMPLFRTAVNTVSFIEPDKDREQSWSSGDGADQYCGTGQSGAKSEGVLRFGSDRRTERLHIVNNPVSSEASMYMNNAVIGHYCRQTLKLADGASKWMDPVFYVFDDRDLTLAELQALTLITFEDQEGRV